MISSNRSSSGEIYAEKDLSAERDAQGHSGHDDPADTHWRGRSRHTIAKVIEQTSKELLAVGQGSMYRALHRVEDRKWVSSHWGVKFYRLTAEGRKELVRETSRWRQMTRAIGLVLGEERGAQ
jgi:PadR family transcriptional regulator, regulatory protein PadR